MPTLTTSPQQKFSTLFSLHNTNPINLFLFFVASVVLHWGSEKSSESSNGIEEEPGCFWGLLPCNDGETGNWGVHEGADERFSVVDGQREEGDNVWELEEKLCIAWVGRDERWWDKVHAKRRWSWWWWSTGWDGVLHSNVQVEPCFDEQFQGTFGGSHFPFSLVSFFFSHTAPSFLLNCFSFFLLFFFFPFLFSSYGAVCGL